MQRREASLGLSLRNVQETLAVCFPTLVEAVQGKVTRQVCDDRLAKWSQNIVENLGIELDVRGRENIGTGPYLVMSNHQSHYDVPVLFRVIGSNLRMVTKKELFRLPIFGRALAVGGFISIDRSDRQSAIESLNVAKGLLASGTHVWISPEGTRSKTGELLPFKKGGFYLAMDAGLQILPVTLVGTRDILPVSAMRSVRGQRVKVTLHRPIDPRNYTAKEPLMEDVRAAIASAL
jgi:1-acyl-sn-glycerol-3-phosphate acyltransferase